jgi:DNA topoisomerase-2
MKIEPEFYAPIIPMVLINGAKGIGTGWSTTIPSFNPDDVINNIRRLINDEPLLELEPWVRGFEGEIEKDSEEGYVTKGVWDECEDDTVEITELPLGTFTKDYREMLEKMITETKEVVDIKEFHTRTKVKFEVKFKPGELEAMYKSGTFEKKMKLSSSISTTNMVAFNHRGKLVKFSTANDFIRVYYPVRLELYGKRKDYLLKILTQEKAILDSKIRFVQMVI